jgi:hypothetical protein
MDDENVNKRISDAFKKGASSDVILDLSNLSIENIPVIPTNVKLLILNDNKLTKIPDENKARLPQFGEVLTDLFIDNNSLTKLPNLPNNLEFLSCKNNKLTALPKLPDTLTFLDCTYNKLENIPEIPKGCTLIFYPQEQHILEVPLNAKNAIMYEPILLGNSIVDFNDEAEKYNRYYTKNTFDKLEKHPFNPNSKIGSKKKAKSYIARLTKKNKPVK